MSETRRRLAVLGSPISHSKSPTLHRAAYQVLGLPWDYEAIEIRSDDLAEFVCSRGAEWRGLSLTMPLKREILPLLDGNDGNDGGDGGDGLVGLTGAANTVLFDRGRRGFNTDVSGIVQAFESAGVVQLRSAQILGGGATATSALVAMGRLGVARVLVSVRNPERASGLGSLAKRLGIELTIRSFAESADADPEHPAVDVIVSTLPGHVEHRLAFSEETRARSIFFDVAYDPWPTPLAAAWLAAGGRVISGLGLLVYQALAQVRIDQ
ncbi:MAG: shikimate dehydrogenase [Lacisediminihabitans sp.]